jgi:hypothetical protein
MRSGIKDDGWRWVFGMLAAYGLRGHEVYKADLADFPTVRIPQDTKNGRAVSCGPCILSGQNNGSWQTEAMPPLRNIPSYTNGQLGTKHLSFLSD